MTYDDNYSKTDAFFGKGPESILTRFFDQMGEMPVVLDVGAGQGRHSIFLAKNLLEVHALEPSNVAANDLQSLADENHLDIAVYRETFETFNPPLPAYSGIMIFGLIPDLGWTGIDTLLQKIENWSRPGTLVWLTGFTTKDPGIRFYRDNWNEVSDHSFSGTDGRIRTYLETNQILTLFPGYKVLHHWEGLGPRHTHGDGAPEQHGVFEAVLQYPCL